MNDQRYKRRIWKYSRRVFVTISTGETHVHLIGSEVGNFKTLMRQLVTKYDRNPWRLKDMLHRYFVVKNGEKVINNINEIATSDNLFLIRRTDEEFIKHKEIEIIDELLKHQWFSDIEVNIPLNFKLPNEWDDNEPAVKSENYGTRLEELKNKLLRDSEVGFHNYLNKIEKVEDNKSDDESQENTTASQNKDRDEDSLKLSQCSNEPFDQNEWNDVFNDEETDGSDIILNIDRKGEVWPQECDEQNYPKYVEFVHSLTNEKNSLNSKNESSYEIIIEKKNLLDESQKRKEELPICENEAKQQNSNEVKFTPVDPSTQTQSILSCQIDSYWSESVTQVLSWDSTKNIKMGMIKEEFIEEIREKINKEIDEKCISRAMQQETPKAHLSKTVNVDSLLIPRPVHLSYDSFIIK
jgi:hypothetical protein